MLSSKPRWRILTKDQLYKLGLGEVEVKGFPILVKTEEYKEIVLDLVLDSADLGQVEVTTIGCAEDAQIDDMLDEFICELTISIMDDILERLSEVAYNK